MEMKRTAGEIAKWIAAAVLAICSAAALFADVESTGNMSAALNGAGIAQLISVVLLTYVYRGGGIKGAGRYKRTLREWVVYGIISFLFTIFMIIGKGQTAEPDLKYNIFAVLLFAGYMPLFYMLVSRIGDRLVSVDFTSRNSGPSKFTKWLFEDHVMLGVMLVIILSRLPYLIAFYPCSMSWDGGAQICEFYGVETFSNHHPPLISYLYGSVAFYAQKWGIPNLGMFVIPVGQTMLSAFAAAKVCQLFKELKTVYCIRIITLAYYALFTVWSIFDVTYIKDSVYWQFTLLYTVQLAWCIVDKEKFWSRKRNFLWMLLWGFLMTQTRNNGIFVLLFSIPVLTAAVPRKKLLVYGGGVAAMFTAVYLVNNILYPSLGVIKLAEKEDTYCIMFQQTAKYGQDYPEDVTAEEREFLNKMFDYDELVEVYNPRLADWVKNCLKICEATSKDGTNSEFAAIKSEYFHVWFEQFKRHPLSYIDTFFACSYGYYYPEVRPYKEGMGFYEMDRNMFTESMHQARQISALAPARFLLEQISKLEYVPGIGLLYRCGFYTWLIVSAAGYLFVQRKYREMIAVIPAAVNILVCLISPVNTCMRYAMPAMCMIPVILGFLFYSTGNSPKITLPRNP